jgi:hypothetical protein
MHRLGQTLKIPEVQGMADLFAVSSSGLCMIHCLATPVLLIFVPVFSASFLGGEAFHATILWFILPTSLVAMTLGCWRHKDRYVAVLCVIGLSVIVMAARFGDAVFGEIGERILTTAGSFILIAGHFRNFSLCRHAACEE